MRQKNNDNKHEQHIVTLSRRHRNLRQKTIHSQRMDRKMRQIKRIHDIDIKPALSVKTTPTSNRWTEKTRVKRQDFIWGAGPSAIETITKEEFNTDPDTINTKKLRQLFKDYYMPKTQQLSQPWRLLLGKARRKRNNRSSLAETSIVRKEL